MKNFIAIAAGIVIAAFLAASTLAQPAPPNRDGAPRVDLENLPPGAQIGTGPFAGVVMGPRSPRRYHVLVLMASKGHHHDSIPDAAAAIYTMGKESGLWDTEFSTDYSLINARPAASTFLGFQPVGLADFDAIVLNNTSGNWDLSPENRRAFLDYIRSGHGVVGIHAALDSNENWPEYTEMIGGFYGGHPWNVARQPIFDFPIINEDPSFPATARLPRRFRLQDELYLPAANSFSRNNVNVLLRLDETQLDWTGVPASAGDGRDAAIAWARMYGEGRVFYSSIGHTKESWMDPAVRDFYFEAIRWALGRTEGATSPHRKRN